MPHALNKRNNKKLKKYLLNVMKNENEKDKKERKHST